MIHLRIKEVAQEHGMTLTDVCERCGYKSLPSFYRQINKPESLNMKTLMKIADAIGCEVGDFFNDEMSEDNDSSLVTRCPHCGKEIRVKLE